MYSATIGARRYRFDDLKALMAKATPLRSGDQLAGLAAETGEERVAAQYALADVPLAAFLQEHVVPYKTDEVTRLIVDSHDRAAFAPVAPEAAWPAKARLPERLPPLLASAASVIPAGGVQLPPLAFDR